jgi:hypothetical protein
MVETYGQDEQRFYFVAETVPGTTPAAPAMLSVPCETIDPGFSPGNLLLRGAGSYDLQAIKKGTREPSLKIAYPVPSSNPIELLQWARTDLDKTLSAQVLYHKGTWASPTDILSLLYTYLRIGKVTLSCEIDDVVKAQLELMGQNLTTGTTKLVDATYTDHTGAIAFNETSIKFNSVLNERVTGWKIGINNNPRRVPVIRATNGELAKYVPFGKRELSGEVSFEFESKAELDAALSDAAFTIEIGLYGTNHLAMSSCKWSNITHERWLEDLVAVKATFDAVGPLEISAS